MPTGFPRASAVALCLLIAFRSAACAAQDPPAAQRPPAERLQGPPPSEGRFVAPHEALDILLGMTREQVLEREGRPPDEGDAATATYYADYGPFSGVTYAFEGGVLRRISYAGLHPSDDSVYDAYEWTKAAVSSAWGAPAVEDETFGGDRRTGPREPFGLRTAWDAVSASVVLYAEEEEPGAERHVLVIAYLDHPLRPPGR